MMQKKTNRLFLNIWYSTIIIIVILDIVLYEYLQFEISYYIFPFSSSYSPQGYSGYLTILGGGIYFFIPALITILVRKSKISIEDSKYFLLCFILAIIFAIIFKSYPELLTKEQKETLSILKHSDEYDYKYIWEKGFNTKLFFLIITITYPIPYLIKYSRNNLIAKNNK